MADKKELVKFLNKIGAEKKFRIEEDLGSGYVRLNIEESQRRQAKHDIRSVEDVIIELIRNSRDAGAKHILVASRLRKNFREVWVIDDGEGIPSELHNKIFEARVTSKVDKFIEDDYGIHGRGMALYAIKIRCVNVSVVKISRSSKLTVFKITSDTNNLPEKSDQSTLPKVKKSKGRYEFKGPFNIPRIIAEFAFKSENIKFYYGLPSQIAGNLVDLAKNESVFSDFEKKNINDFCANFNDYFGFELSKRNAYRCLSGEIKGVNFKKYFEDLSKKNKIKIKSYSSMIEDNDLEPIILVVRKKLDEAAEKYNLTVTDAKVLKKGNAIKILLALAKADEI